MAHDADFRRELGQQLRVDSVRASAAAGSGHPTSSMSAADLMAVLIDGHLRLDYAHPHNPANDHLIFSKGHASPLYYSVLKAVGSIDDEELLTFRKLATNHDLAPLYEKWFMRRLPTGEQMNVPMSPQLEEAFKALDTAPTSTR